MHSTRTHVRVPFSRRGARQRRTGWWSASQHSRRLAQGLLPGPGRYGRPIFSSCCACCARQASTRSRTVAAMVVRCSKAWRRSASCCSGVKEIFTRAQPLSPLRGAMAPNDTMALWRRRIDLPSGSPCRRLASSAASTRSSSSAPPPVGLVWRAVLTAGRPRRASPCGECDEPRREWLTQNRRPSSMLCARGRDTTGYCVSGTPSIWYTRTHSGVAANQKSSTPVFTGSCCAN